MRKLKSIDGLRRRLLRNGLPAGYVVRAAQELEDHREDLFDELREEGVVGVDAERKVAERMGSYDELAEGLSRTMRRSNWWGRHPVVTFCILPVLLFALGFGLVAFTFGGIAEAAGWWESKTMLTQRQWNWVSFGVQFTRWSLFTAIPFWFCWLARNAFCGYGWGLATCVVFSIHGLLHRLKFVAPVKGGDGSLAWGYSNQFDWLGMSVPLLIFGLFIILSKSINASEMRQQRGIQT